MTWFGKLTFWLGIVFLVIGTYLFIIGERLIPLLTIGVCFLLACQLYRKNENDPNHFSDCSKKP
ncbi:hypothetical protein [Bacillus sp. NPDC077027]|uniref:hypothetical protein n=1 Tax=Bacillus sp. NPDC077027 TaxID=3390548 RepID=UPI003D036164